MLDLNYCINPSGAKLEYYKRTWPVPVSWWRHQMETFSALLALCAGNSPVPVNSPHKGQWRGALMFTLIYARINGWVNTREAGDLRRYGPHYDVIVMVADALVLCIRRKSATMILIIMQDKWVHVLHWEGSQWCVQSQCRKMRENTNLYMLDNTPNGNSIWDAKSRRQITKQPCYWLCRINSLGPSI